MDKAPETKPNILEVAWRLHAQFDETSKKRAKTKNRLHWWVAIISILATLFAILSSIYPGSFPQFGGFAIKVLLIIFPILASIVASFANKFFPGGDWLILRAGAELVQKEIYQYRTILQKKAQRRQWLEDRLRDIHQQVYNGLNAELILEPYTGKLPPTYDQSNSRSDPGFNDLTFEEYFNYRVQDQLDWHTRKVQQLQRERVNMQILILFTGGAGAFLAAMGGSLSIWVALSTSLTTALIGAQEIRNLDKTVRNYSRVILELTAVSNHWHNLEVTERTRNEFYKMVQATETLLWNQFVDYIKSMQQVLAAAKPDGADLINETLKQSEGEKNSDITTEATDSTDITKANELLISLPTSDEVPQAKP